MNKYWRIGDKVTWKETSAYDGELETYTGVITDLLSTQMLVYPTNGAQRFVFYRDPTLKAYRQGEKQ